MRADVRHAAQRSSGVTREQQRLVEQPGQQRPRRQRLGLGDVPRGRPAIASCGRTLVLCGLREGRGVAVVKCLAASRRRRCPGSMRIAAHADTMEGLRGRSPPGHAIQASASDAADDRRTHGDAVRRHGASCGERAARLLLTNASRSERMAKRSQIVRYAKTDRGCSAGSRGRASRTRRRRQRRSCSSRPSRPSDLRR